VTFDEFINQAWNDHGKDAQGVANRLAEGQQLLVGNDQIPRFAGLVAHLLGDHLGQWGKGVSILSELKALKFFKSGSESEFSIDRSVAALQLAAGQSEALARLSPSDRVRAMASAASALCGQNEVARAESLLVNALELVESSCEPTDAAYRGLAIAANSMASGLEAKVSRSERETALMILAAKAARKSWEVAGTWLEVERAEYRLAQSYLKAGDVSRANEHAKNCLAIVRENEGPALEYFFAYETLALSAQDDASRRNAIALAEEQFHRLSAEDQGWCLETLEALRLL